MTHQATAQEQTDRILDRYHAAMNFEPALVELLAVVGQQLGAVADEIAGVRSGLSFIAQGLERQ